MELKVSKFKRFLEKRNNRNALFIAAVAAIPVLQFLIFYVYLNFNTVIMAFQTYVTDKTTGIGSYKWCAFDNFVRAYHEYLPSGLLWKQLKNTAFYFLTCTCVITPFALLFSYYIYKKRFASQIFKIVLFMPSIISSIIIVLMYNYFMEIAVPKALGSLFKMNVGPLISTKETAFITVLFYCVWTGFGTGILMYSGAMGGISESVVEAACMDGATMMKEFWHVTLPSVYPTLSTFLIAQLAGVFIADMNLFSFFGSEAEGYIKTIGYDLLRLTRGATYAEYPYLAAIGLMLTMITLPIAYGGKYLINKLGPTTE